MMKFLSKLCALSFTSLTLARLSIHPAHSVYDARRWTLEDNDQATHERFHLIRRQLLPAPYDLKHRPEPQVVNDVWQDSDISLDLQSSGTLSKNLLLLARRASVAASSSRPLSSSSSDLVANRSSSSAGFDDPPESDVAPDTNSNTNYMPRAITRVATPTPTATNASSRSNLLSVTSTSPSAQATHARGTLTSTSDTISHATPSATSAPSITPSASSDPPTFVNVFQHLGSYFKPSSGAFPAAIMITIAAGLLILLMIISVAKCICHKPKFANAKDYPEGFPWDPHHNGSQISGKGRNRAAGTEYKRVTSQLKGGKSDRLLFDPSSQVIALPQVYFQNEGKADSECDAWGKNQSALTSPAPSARHSFAAEPLSTTHDPLDNESSYFNLQARRDSSFADPRFSEHVSISKTFQPAEQGHDVVFPIRAPS